jgi:hypothetical protein
MKISQVKPLIQTLNKKGQNEIIKVTDKKVRMLNCELTIKELQSIYRDALKQLSHDVYGGK